jgi:hypothetical protein
MGEVFLSGLFQVSSYGLVKTLFDVTKPINMKPKTIAAANAVRDHCPPKDVTIAKAVDMLRKAFTDHPTQAGLGGAALLDDLGRSIEHLTTASHLQLQRRGWSHIYHQWSG